MSGVEIGSDPSRVVNDGVDLPQCGFEVAQEAMEDGMGDEHDQPEDQQGVGMVVEDMAGMPGSDQLVETFIFDAPAVVPELKDDVGRIERARHGCRPIPMRVDGRVDANSGDQFVACAGFVGGDDRQRGADGVSGEWH